MKERQLSIFGEEKTMAVSDIAVVLGVTEKTVLKYTAEVFPGKIKNGIKTELNELEITAVKLKMQQNQHLERSVELPKTDLEKELLIQQAMQFQAEKVLKLELENEEQKKRLEEAQHKIDFHDKVGDSTGLLSIGQTAKILGTGRTRLFDWLRGKNIFMGREPYQKYIDQGYFKVKTTESNGHIQKQAFTTPKGLIWLQKRFK